MKPMGNLFASKVFEGLRESAGTYADDQALLHLGAEKQKVSNKLAKRINEKSKKDIRH